MVEQIKKLCSDNKTSIKALEKELGFGNGTIRRWDTNAPSVDKIILVANRFNVPVSSITGTDEQKEKPTLQMESELKISDDDMKHLKQFHRADPATKEAIRLLLLKFSEEEQQ